MVQLEAAGGDSRFGESTPGFNLLLTGGIQGAESNLEIGVSTSDSSHQWVEHRL